MPLLGFDIETANIITLARGENLDDHGPLAYLSRMQHEGHSIVAWNGLSFDMRWLGHAAGDMQTAARVAMKLYDPMFQFYKLKGFPVGLAAVGKGLGGNQICVICVPYPQCPTRSSTIPF